MLSILNTMFSILTELFCIIILVQVKYQHVQSLKNNQLFKTSLDVRQPKS